MNIVSFLPGSTEIVFALGLGDQLVGVTHECDYPEGARNKPVVVRPSFQPAGLSPQQIDAVVTRSLRKGESLYVVDEAMLRGLSPDVILTQDLCQVCAPSGNEVGRVLKHLDRPPRIVWLSPNTLSDILDNIREVGEAVGRRDAADRLILDLAERIRRVRERRVSSVPRPRVFCMEWISPPFNAGHWMPELVGLAGGEEGLAEKGRDSRRIAWEQILDYAPEVLILCPCGYDLKGAAGQASLLRESPGWDGIPAVRNGRVYAVDANSYFARPGPRIVDGLELMAHLIHPERFDWNGPENAYRRMI